MMAGMTVELVAALLFVFPTLTGGPRVPSTKTSSELAIGPSRSDWSDPDAGC